MMRENERSLYPLRFEPQVTDTGWGKETLLIGDLGFAESVVVNGWLEESSLEDTRDISGESRRRQCLFVLRKAVPSDGQEDLRKRENAGHRMS